MFYISYFLIFFSTFFLVFPLTTKEPSKQEEKFCVNLHRQLRHFLLPDDHPVSLFFNTLSQTKRIVRSKKTLKECGFRFLRNDFLPYSPLIFKHSHLRGFIFKTFLDEEHPLTEELHELGQWIARVSGSQAISKMIKKYKMTHFIVPKKWVYKLPKAGKISSSSILRNYILVAERMPLVDFDLNTFLWKNISKDILDELYVLTHDLNLWDLHRGNLHFTKEGTLAFVDTKHWGTFQTPGGSTACLVGRVAESLNEEMREYWFSLWFNNALKANWREERLFL